MNDLRGKGVDVRSACGAVGLSRSSYYSRSAQRKRKERAADDSVQPDGLIVERIRAIKTAHPFWGYRRVRAWLVHRENISISKNKVHRLMRENGFLVNRKAMKAKRTPQRSKPRAERPRQFWGIDMTKFMVGSLGWVYLVVVLDWYTKKIVGYDISLRSRTEEWKRAMDAALNVEFPCGVRGSGLSLVSDNGSQPTSVSFMKDMATLGIEQVFTSYDNPKGNADTERVIRTTKEEVIWVNEFESLEEAREAISAWFRFYNGEYVHSALGYRSPVEFEEIYRRRESEAA